MLTETSFEAAGAHATLRPGYKLALLYIPNITTDHSSECHSKYCSKTVSTKSKSSSSPFAQGSALSGTCGVARKE